MARSRSLRAPKAIPLPLHKADVGLYLGVTGLLAVVFVFASMALNTHCTYYPNGSPQECSSALPLSWLIIGSVILEAAGIVAIGLKHHQGPAWFGFVKAPAKPAAKLVAIGLILIAAMEFVTLILAKFIPFFTKAEYGLVPTRATLGDIPSVIAIALFASLVAPVLEEFLFRGVYFRAIWAKTGPVAAAIISSLVFTLAHGISGATVTIFLQGLYLCYMYKSTASIVPGMVLHGINNLVAVTLLAVGLGG
jgi:membrane protease YdiL (CAAX protease family)